MRTSLQTVVGLRLQFGRRLKGSYKSAPDDAPAILRSIPAVVDAGIQERLTQTALTGIRDGDRAARIRGAEILKLQETHKGRKRLRAMRHRWREEQHSVS